MADKTMKLAFVLSATDKMSRIINDAVDKSSSKLSAFERNSSKISGSMNKAGALMVGTSAAIGAATFGLAKTTANYGDEMMKTSQKVGIGVEQWQKLAYTAKYAGVETSQLQGGMTRLVKKMNQAANGSASAGQVFKDLGINIKDSAGNLRAPNEIFEELSEKFANVKDGSAKTALAVELFGNSGADLIPMLNMGRDAIAAMGQEAEETGNILTEDTCRASEKFNDDLTRMKDGLKGASMQIGATLMPMLNALVEKVNAVISKITGWIKENPKLVKTISKIVLGIAAALAVMGTASMVIGTVIGFVGKFIGIAKKLITIVKAVTKFIKLFNLALLNNPIVWIIGIIIVLATAVYMIIKHWDKVKAFFQKLWAGVKAVFSKVWEWIKNMFLNYTPVGLVIKHWAKIKEWFGKLWDGVKKVFSVVWEWIKKLLLFMVPALLIFKHWDKIKAWFGKLWDAVKNVFKKTWDWIKKMFLNYTPHGLIIKHWDKIKAFFANLWDGIKNLFKAAWEGIKNIVLYPIELIKLAWANLKEWFGKLWGGIKGVAFNVWGGIKNICSKAKEGVQKSWAATKGFFSKLWKKNKEQASQNWEGIKNICGKAKEGVQKAWSATKGFFSKLWGKNKEQAATNWGKIKDIGSKAKDGVQSAWAGTKGWFSNLWGKIKGDSQSAWGGIASSFKEMKPLDWIKGAWDSVSSFFSGLGKKFFEWGKNLLSSLWNGIKSIASKPVEGIKNVGKKIAGGFKSFFGIKSPSRLFMEYGVNITEGLVGGIEDSESQAEKATGSLAEKTMRGMDEGMAGTPGGTVNNSSVSNVTSGPTITYAPNITINGTMAPQQQQDFGRLLKDHARELEEAIKRIYQNHERLAFG